MRKTAAFAAVLAVGGVLGAGALADSGPPIDTTTAATTTAEPTQLPEGITIGGVPVGGLEPTEALAAVRATFTEPLTLVFAGHRIGARPDELGAVGYAQRAVAAAGHAAPESAIPLEIAIRPGPLRHYLRRLARRLDRRPVDAVLDLRNGRPFVSREQAGIALQVEPAVKAVRAELLAGDRTPLRLPGKAVAPKLTRRGFGPVIVIHRGANRLQLYNGMRFLKSFGVATGQSAYPTPLGRFSIVVKWRNPWWYPPASPWAAGEKPTPPGPGNPLGTRWMGLSAPGVGIHGTPNSASIGYSLSHGCIRMLIPQAEWLFDHVEIGTPVFIVAS
jgi:lipoprotein-anchoring transpeptidase ErfK/SrfK